MSTVQDTAANDPRLNLQEGERGPIEGVVLPDWNQTELPETYPYAAYPQIDNNADSGVVIDMNAVPADERDPEETVEPVTNEDARKLIEEYETDPEDDWIGARRGADAIDLPHSIYLSPDLSFKDPPDLEEPYEVVAETGDLPLRPRLREPL